MGTPHTQRRPPAPCIRRHFLCCTCLNSFIVCTCELCEIYVKSLNECIFLPHVYRASTVQWAVCMKANVLIYKWSTLGETWCLVLFSSVLCPGKWLPNSPLPERQCRGCHPRENLVVKAKATFLMTCLLRVMPSVQCLTVSEVDTDGPGQLWNRSEAWPGM